MYKAIFIDIDGTLRDSNKNISERNKNAIKQISEKGILVVLCSGRPQKYTENISKSCFASNYIITSNGANIYDYKNKKTIYNNILEKKACIELFKLAETSKARIIMYSGEGMVVNYLKYFDGSETLLETDIESFVEKNDVVQCVIADKDFNKINNLLPIVQKIENCEIKNRHKSLYDNNAPKVGDIYCDVALKKASKGNAIKEFCKALNIDLKDTIAIGDALNDISMFEIAGYSVAMGNADTEVKKTADEITKTNNEDGVAVFLEKIVIKN